MADVNSVYQDNFVYIYYPKSNKIILLDIFSGFKPSFAEINNDSSIWHWWILPTFTAHTKYFIIRTSTYSLVGAQSSIYKLVQNCWTF